MISSRLFHLWCQFSALLLLSALGLLLGFIVVKGYPAMGVTLYFGQTAPLDGLLGLAPIWDGIWPACVGTLSVVSLALLLALFPGIGCGIWLAQSAPSRCRELLTLAVDILAGFPSILMGLFGFTLILLLRQYLLPNANTSLLLSATCLALLILPYLAVTTRTALLALPPSLMITAQALGMSRSQTLGYVLLPQAIRGISGGIMLAFGRAAEDTAVIMLTGAVANAGLPGGLFERYEALPFIIFYYSAQYQSEDELQLAFGAALTLLFITAGLFSLASALLHRKTGNTQ